MRKGSPNKYSGISSDMSVINSSFFACAPKIFMFMVVRINFSIEKRTDSAINFPASIFEKSKTLLTKLSNISPESLIFCR